MDADEARKALDLARKHDENGNIEAALKWARKSVAIYSTPEAMALFTRLKEKGTQGTPSADSGASSAPKAVLNVQKTATDTEVKKSYKKVCISC